jgi:aspartate racemase
MSKHIGIVACSAVGAALCYRTICSEGAVQLGPHGHPEITMHTPPLAEYVERIDRDDWRGVGELMLASAQKLAAVGADVLICPDNTIHAAFPYVEERLPRPWIHIADSVSASAAERGFRSLGLLGTKYLVESGVYPENLAARGIGCMRPDPLERQEVNRIIMDELVYGVVEPRSAEYVYRVIARMKEEGCDAVVLGCTELPLIVEEAASPLPSLDSTRLLARAALRAAIAP